MPGSALSPLLALLPFIRVAIRQKWCYYDPCGNKDHPEENKKRLVEICYRRGQPPALALAGLRGGWGEWGNTHLQVCSDGRLGHAEAGGGLPSDVICLERIYLAFSGWF